MYHAFMQIIFFYGFEGISYMKSYPASANRTKFDLFYWKVNKSQ